MRLRRISFLSAILLLPLSAVFAQTAMTQEGGGLGAQGLSQGGAFGLFVQPSAAVLDQGRIAAGIFYDGEFGSEKSATGFPISLGFGVTQRVEAFASFNSYRFRDQQRNDHSILGLKVHLLDFGPEGRSVSADLRIQRMEQSLADLPSEDGTAFSIRLIGNSSIMRVAEGYINVGYAVGNERFLSKRGQLIGGCALTVPLNYRLLVGVEAGTLDGVRASQELQGMVGMKLILFEHLQLAGGARLSRREGNTIGGVFFGLSFSSDILRARRGPGIEPPLLLPEPPPLEDSTATEAHSLYKKVRVRTTTSKLTVSYRWKSDMGKDQPSDRNARLPDGQASERIEPRSNHRQRS